MKPFAIISFLGILALSLFLQCGELNNSFSKHDFDVEKIVGKWVKSWNTYDLNAVDQLFLQDSTLTYFSSEKQGIIKGIEAVREHHQGFGFVKNGKDQPNKLWVEDLDYSVFGNTAVVTGIWYFQREDGSKQFGPVTIVYVKVDDELKIAHMNFGNYFDAEESK